MQARRFQASDRGASFVEYGAVAFLVAAVVAAVLGTGLAGRIGGIISDALECVWEQEEGCPTDDSEDQAAPGDESEPRPQDDPKPGTGDDPADADSPDNANPTPEASGDWSDGVVTQAADLGDGAMDGVDDALCLAHMCENEEFQGTWNDVGDTAANADPAVWEPEDGGPETSNVLFGLGGDDPELAPDPDASPEEVNDWWEGLTEAERTEVMEEEPENIRDLDGVPSDVRDDLNREFLDDEVDRLLEEEELTLDEVLNRGDDDIGSTEVQELVDLQDTLQNGRAESDGDVVVDGEEYYLLALDPDEERSIVSRGNPDTADNVSTMVPGTGIEWTAVNGQLGRADNVHEAATTADRGDSEHASIAWIGYDTPNWAQVASRGSAREGKDELVSFQDGLRVTHQGEPSNNTVIGHSYGSTMVGMSGESQFLSPDTLDADNVIFTGSPGTTSSEADDLSVDNVHATRSEDDEIVGDFLAWTHGPDVTSEVYGAETFESDPGTTHSQYFDDPEASQMQYMGEVVAGER